MCTPDSHLAAQERDLHRLYLNLFPACRYQMSNFPNDGHSTTPALLLYNVIHGVMHEQT